MTDEERARELISSLAFYADYGAQPDFVGDRDKVVALIKAVRAEAVDEPLEQLTIRRVLERWDLVRDGGIGQLAEAIQEALRALRAPGGKGG